ncbi:MAG: SusD/RagB family nutrient-binding outer membrane lipoprotein [Muricauda sp.]|mgnify:CR=1 FL=1|nr:SusD/RagB family nutrient-binding outer membrane lipoprotein [uncultured Allomuricauda sp.]MBC74280.1 SusD/RagB family nutrient-binding outer membrane lipoprotein [Allomuricauda sp.]|tara:strand:- start:2614 stop:4200 length:1587 start_codon:yes stop_codon:yes gene_type:complete
MKNLIKIHILLGVAFVATMLSSCDNDSLDEININPNDPEVVPTNTIFNSATKEFMDFSRSSFNSGRLTLNWVEYWGQNSYADEDRYLYRETSAESIFQDSYRVATDLKSILDFNTNEDTRELAAAVGDNNNQIAASRIMLSYLFHQLTNTFGDIPYYSYGSSDESFQALQIDEVLSPVFTEQVKIYTDILNELRQAADMINESSPVFTSGDNIYNGDASKWKKFANSLILRVAMNLMEVNPTTASNAIDAALKDGVFTSNDDNALQRYETSDVNASPWWRAYIGRTDFAVAAPFIDLLKGNTGGFSLDPRLFEMAAPIYASIESIQENSYERSENPDDYFGVPFAYQNVNSLPFTAYSFPGSMVLRPDFSEVLMEYAEVVFIISEYKGFSQEEYEKGVRASMEKWGVASSDIADFMTSLPAATEANVLNQKYIALYMQAHQAWADYRRTGFPDVLMLPGDTYNLPSFQADFAGESSYIFIAGVPIDDLPKRLRYPVSLQTLNGINRTEAVSKLSNGDSVESPLFWDID